MSKIALTRTPAGFVPSTAYDEDTLEPVKIGGQIHGDFRQQRNPRHHNKAFALLRAMYENQEQFDSFDRFYDWTKVRAGLVDLVELTEDGPVYKLQSLSWGSMGQERFDKAYQAIVTVAFEVLGMENVLVEFA